MQLNAGTAPLHEVADAIEVGYINRLWYIANKNN